MRRRLVVLAAALGSGRLAAAETAAPATMRPDYHRRTPFGAFRGANFDAIAYYRPQLDCVMFTRNEVPFCRVCQRALEQVIDLHAGPRRAA